MLILQESGVNQLYTEGVRALMLDGVLEQSRAGEVLVMPYPVMSIYTDPCERVLFDPERDANPFFHLFESLWMLAGRNDASILDHYIKNFSTRFAEAGDYVHGAYGFRWRNLFHVDQLNTIVDKLKSNPHDRQAVLQMWDSGDSNDLMAKVKDRPCNTHCYFRIRDGFLDMTIMCRSNDIIWGAYGANAVHFSMLLEYMAGRIGINVGTMYQFSNNFHAYNDILNKIGMPNSHNEVYNHLLKPAPIGDQWDVWDSDLSKFMTWHDYLWGLPEDCDELDTPDNIRNEWFHTVAGPMTQVKWLWNAGRRDDALNHVLHIEATDWRAAANMWIHRRKK